MDRRGFTLIELLVVIAVIAILAALVMPAIMSAMKQAGTTTCKSNLHQIGVASQLYANQYAQFFPVYGDWYPNGYEARLISPPWALLPYTRDRKLYLCAADPTPGDPWWWNLNHFDLTELSYMWNEHIMTIDNYPSGRARPISTYPKPHRTGLVSDGWAMPNGWTWNTAMPYEMFTGSRIDFDHGGKVNMLILDASVQTIPQVDLPKMLSDPLAD